MKIESNSTELILDSLGEGVFTVDKDFRIQFFNRAAERITGYKREEVIGRICKQVFRSSICPAGCPITKVLESGRNLHDMDAQICQRKGKLVHVKLNAAILRDRGEEPIGGVISFRDLSDLELLKKNLARETQFCGIVGHSKAMQEIFQLIQEIADSDATVLIQGESGTGKEMIANAIQQTSTRKDKPYVKINCSVFPPHLLASELFGHVKGAFTGAIKDRPGRFEVADGGTLFLDEVAEMPLQMQLQLLRVLQEGTFERIGESITRKVDVRVIAATNVEIEQALREGKFREDLYYRLNVIPIEVPPLRERKEDIPHLVRHFIRKFSLVSKKRIYDIADEAMDLLLQYPWPGNVRELENAIEYAFARSTEGVIQANKLPLAVREYRSPKKAVIPVVHSDEARSLLALLEKHQWNRTRVARELGIGRTTLWRKMRKLGLVK